MPVSQIDDMLMFDDAKVTGKGTLERSSGEVIKTFWVRVCQREHPAGTLSIAEASVHNDDSSPVFNGTQNTWTLNLPVKPGRPFVEGDATVSAVLVFEDGGDLFTLAWAECVHLMR